MAGLDLAKVVSCTRAVRVDVGRVGAGQRATGQAGRARFHVVAYDFGIKHNILRMLAERGCRLTVVPAQTPARDVLRAASPTACSCRTAPAIRSRATTRSRAIRDDRRRAACPRSASASAISCSGSRRARRTMKMKFGHHGANHPVLDRDTGQVLITSQNHGFAVDAATLPAERARHARVAVRRQPAGHRAHRPAGVRLPGPSGSEPRPARPRLPVRSLRQDDGTKQT